MANGYLQGKYEQTSATDFTPNPGSENTTPVYSSKTIYFPIISSAASLNPNPLERDDELRNSDQPFLRVTDVFDPTYSYDSRAYPDLSGWWLAMLLGRDSSASSSVVLTTTTTALITAATVIPVTSATGIAVGQLVGGVNITPGTYVTSVSALNVTVSAAQTLSSGSTVTFATAGNYKVETGSAAVSTTTTASSSTAVIAVTSATGITVGQYVVGTGIPANTKVVSIASLNITLSAVVAVASGAAVSFGTATDIDGTALLAANQFAHTWTAPFGPSGAIPQTANLTYAYKDQSAFFQLKGAACEQFTLDTPDQGGVQIKAEGPAAYLTSISDPSNTPAYESVSRRPFVHANLAVSYADQSGSGYTTANAGVASGFTVQARNPVNAIRTLGGASQSPDRLEKDDGPIMFSGTIAKRNLTKADWDAMRALSTFQLSAKWKSTDYITGTSGAVYGLSVTVPNAQLVAGSPDALDNKRRHGASYTWNAAYDGTSASVVVKLCNATSTYAT